jgi:hypothetical protein
MEAFVIMVADDKRVGEIDRKANLLVNAARAWHIHAQQPNRAVPAWLETRRLVDTAQLLC